MELSPSMNLYFNHLKHPTMKQTILAGLAFLFTLSACNLDSRKLSEDEISNLKKNHDDSLTIVQDSSNKINIDAIALYDKKRIDSIAIMETLKRTKFRLPALYDKEIFDSSTTVNFSKLAKATNGETKLLINSKLITTEIANIVRSHATVNADLLILIDKTGSMSDDIENVKNGLDQVVNSIRPFKNIRLAIALYGDKNADGADWYSFKNFEKDYNSAKEYISNITVTNGGDYPESVYEGFFKSCEQDFWQSDSKKMVVLIGDAPPLEKPLSDYSLEDVIKKANESKIKMNFYPIVVTPVTGSDDGTTPHIKVYTVEDVIAKLYPNPSAGMVTVDFSKSDKYSIEVYNSSGALILSDKFNGSQWKKDLSRFKNGAYIIRAISDAKKFETIKFIISK